MARNRERRRSIPDWLRYLHMETLRARLKHRIESVMLPRKEKHIYQQLKVLRRTKTNKIEYYDSTINPPGVVLQDFSSTKHFPRVQCDDGFNMSVQAGAYLNSRCKNIKCFGVCNCNFPSICDYINVEIGFPSIAEPLLDKYDDDPDDPDFKIFGAVPIKVVIAIIKKHGGMSPERHVNIEWTE